MRKKREKKKRGLQFHCSCFIQKCPKAVLIGFFLHSIAQILFLRFFLRLRELLLCGYDIFQASYGMKPFLSFSIARFFSIAMLYGFSIHSFALVSSPSSTLYTFADTQLRFFSGFSLLSFFPSFFLFFSLFPFPFPPHTNTAHSKPVSHTPPSVLRPHPGWTHAHAGGTISGIPLRRDCD